MYQRLIEEYLTHYQPELKAELIRTASLQRYLESEAAAMRAAKSHLLTQLRERTPHMSQYQQEMEADQVVREMFLPLP